LLKFCEHKRITFTRSRPYKKNDQAHVEEKNGSIVRRLVGYDRYEGQTAWNVLTELYAVLRLYVNFFQPSLKLQAKERNGAKLIKKYDKAQTPYQRLMNSEHITDKKKTELKKQYEMLDPIKLLQDLEKAQNKLWSLAWQKGEARFPLTAIDKPANTDHATDPVPLLNRFYRKTRKPRKPITWRTRKDPFENVKKDIRLQLEINPGLTSVGLLEGLIVKYPGQFHKGNLRTLQRQVSAWRKLQYAKEKEHQRIVLSQGKAVEQFQKIVKCANQLN
jgi:hypothetical protein